MKVLITGSSGFVGAHLAEELARYGHEIILTSPHRFSIDLPGGKKTAIVCDLLNKTTAVQLIKKTRPDSIVHLAGAAKVGRSWEDRTSLVERNVIITHNLCRALYAAARPASFLFTSSSLVYGTAKTTTQGVQSLNEDSLLSPETPYGASKLAAEFVLRSYAGENFYPYIVRSFNHIGPGQGRDFVCTDFAYRMIKAKSPGTISVGNLSTRRDFTDVRDVVRAYRLILEKKPKEHIFVIGSGKSISIEEILQILIRHSGKKILPKADPKLLRAMDPASITADSTLAAKVLGWRCEYSIEQTLQEVYDDVKARIKQGSFAP